MLNRKIKISVIAILMITIMFFSVSCGTSQKTYSQVEETILDAGDTLEEQIEEAVKEIKNFIDVEKLELHQQGLINNLVAEYTPIIEAATLNDVEKAEEHTKPIKENFESDELFVIVKNFTLVANQLKIQPAPIEFLGGSEFFGNLFNNLFIYPVGWIMYILSTLTGGIYAIGLILTTLIVRTAGWPIYTRTNDMSLKMKLMQPEIDKVNLKYEGKNDQNSQRLKQMETMQLYKKYGVGLGGCLMPFLQFPIFMSIYRAISRMPYTEKWISELNTNIFGIDLLKTRLEAGQAQQIGIIVLAVLVVITQLYSQHLMQKKQKEAQEETQKDIPLYKRQAVSQTNQMQDSMKWVMYGMSFMMAMFVFNSAAALGVYWLIGNLYSLVQSIINNKMSSKRLQKLRDKHA